MPALLHSQEHVQHRIAVNVAEQCWRVAQWRRRHGSGDDVGGAGGAEGVPRRSRVQALSWLGLVRVAGRSVQGCPTLEQRAQHLMAVARVAALRRTGLQAL